MRTEGLNEPWQHDRSCCNIISDNQLLVDILTGHAVNNNDNLEPIFTRITNHIVNIHHLGYRTALPGGEYINWRYRDFNKSADRQCNIALDNASNHIHVHTNCHKFLNLRANIFIQSDGGCRHSFNASTTGSTIKAIHLENIHLEIYARGANHITKNHNSLTIEAIALDEALTWFYSTLSANQHTTTNPTYTHTQSQQ